MKLSFEHISKLYGDTAALQQIDLTLGSGVYGLLGPNGAGKTTLMRIMTDLSPHRPDVSCWMGRTLRSWVLRSGKSFGYLPQDFGVYPNFTAEQFLLYIARLKGLSKFEAKRQTDELLRMVGLEDKKQKKLKGFSGGQRQRVGIAQALLGDPEILVLDEPTAGARPGGGGSASAVSSVIFPSKSSFCCRPYCIGSRSSRKQKSFCSGKVLSSKCKAGAGEGEGEGGSVVSEIRRENETPIKKQTTSKKKKKEKKSATC